VVIVCSMLFIVSLFQVAMSTYHTVFLTQAGEVYTCGSGRGGKLGLNHELSVLTPELIQFQTASKCMKIATGVDHTIFLLENGKVRINIGNV
jgi:alpha-tubulin suppressor-like RCC1 family protein